VVYIGRSHLADLLPVLVVSATPSKSMRKLLQGPKKWANDFQTVGY
jgi:hypothetical protein